MAKTVNLSYTRKTAPVRIDVVQYTTAPDIVFIIEDYTPTGRADIYIDKPSGEEIYNTCTIDGNKVIFTPTTQCFAEVGENKAQLQFLDGEKLAVSFLLTFVVQENIIDSAAAESQSEFTELQAAISTIGEYDQRITDVQNAMTQLDTELTDDMAALNTDITGRMTALQDEVSTFSGILDSAFKFVGNISSGTDLDFLSEPGAYNWRTSNPQNIPVSSNYGTVLVFSDNPEESISNSTGVVQIVICRGETITRDHSDVYIRKYSQSVWLPWEKVILARNDGFSAKTYRGLGGYLTNSSKEVRVTVPIEPATRADIDIYSVGLALRTAAGGYPYCTSDGTNYVALGAAIVEGINDYATITGTLVGNNALNVAIAFAYPLKVSGSSSATNVANNSVLGVDIKLAAM